MDKPSPNESETLILLVQDQKKKFLRGNVKMRVGKNEQHSSNFPPIAAQKQHLWLQIDYWKPFSIYFPQLDTHINKKQKVWM